MLVLCFKCISGSNLAVLKLLTTKGNRSEREAEGKENVSVVFFIQENNKDCPEQSLYIYVIQYKIIAKMS